MNVDLRLLNKLHRPVYYKMGVTYIFSGHEFYIFVFITQRSSPTI